MTIYFKFEDHYPYSPSLSPNPITVDEVDVTITAWTTPDFQVGTDVYWYIDSASFSGSTPLTGEAHLIWNPPTIPSLFHRKSFRPEQDINGPLNYETTYTFQITVTGHHATLGAGEGTSPLYEFETEERTIPPDDPINPTPADGATGITLTNNTLSWEDGGGAETYDVYFRPFGEFFEKIASDIPGTSVSTTAFLAAGRYSYAWLYLWCVIAKNEYGANADPPSDFGIGYGGTIWSFNAMLFDPPLPHYTLILLDGPDFSYGDGVNYGGTEGIDWYWDGYNFIRTSKKLVAAAKNTLWYEEHT